MARIQHNSEMRNSVQIRQFQSTDQAALLAFLADAYRDEPRKIDIAFWKWHYLENPLTDPDNIPLWIVESGGKIVGQLATIPVELKVGSMITRAIWILDFIVLEQFRGQGLGKRLVQTAGESFPTMITLGINEQSTAVFDRLGWRALGGLNRYHKLLFPGNAVRELSSIEPLRRFANFCYSPFRPGRGSYSVSDRFSIRAVTEFDDTFTDLWERASGRWPCAVVRSPEYLDWQFLRQPGKKFDVLGLYDEVRLLGYVVLFFRKGNANAASPKAAISDICCDDDDSPTVVDELLRASIDLAVERQAGSLVIDILDPLVESRLKQLGFWRIKASPRFMAITSEYEDLIYNERNWYLTRGDSDVSIFEQSNR